jgi:hypothetical protein
MMNGYQSWSEIGRQVSEKSARLELGECGTVQARVTAPSACLCAMRILRRISGAKPSQDLPVTDETLGSAVRKVCPLPASLFKAADFDCRGALARGADCP